MNIKKLLMAPLVLSFFIGAINLVDQTAKEGSCFGPACGAPASTNNNGTPKDPTDDKVECSPVACKGVPGATVDNCTPSWIANSFTWECACKDIKDPRPKPKPKVGAIVPTTDLILT